MNLCSAEVPPEVDEFELSGLTPMASDLVKPPRVAESKVQMECRLRQILVVSEQPGGGIARARRRAALPHRRVACSMTKKGATRSIRTSSMPSAAWAARCTHAPATASRCNGRSRDAAYSGALEDPAAADHFVAVVEHGRLARRHRALRLVEGGHALIRRPRARAWPTPARAGAGSWPAPASVPSARQC